MPKVISQTRFRKPYTKYYEISDTDRGLHSVSGGATCGDCGTLAVGFLSASCAELYAEKESLCRYAAWRQTMCRSAQQLNLRGILKTVTFWKARCCPTFSSGFNLKTLVSSSHLVTSFWDPRELDFSSDGQNMLCDTASSNS